MFHLQQVADLTHWGKCSGGVLSYTVEGLEVDLVLVVYSATFLLWWPFCGIKIQVTWTQRLLVNSNPDRHPNTSQIGLCIPKTYLKTPNLRRYDWMSRQPGNIKGRTIESPGHHMNGFSHSPRHKVENLVPHSARLNAAPGWTDREVPALLRDHGGYCNNPIL